jgi:hypothetical protein
MAERIANFLSLRMTALRRLCGKTRKMTRRENIDFARRTSSVRVIVTMRRMGGPHAARSPARPNTAAEFSFKAVYGRLNCDRREKSSFSTQSVDTGHFRVGAFAQIAVTPGRRGERHKPPLAAFRSVSEHPKTARKRA